MKPNRASVLSPLDVHRKYDNCDRNSRVLRGVTRKQRVVALIEQVPHKVLGDWRGMLYFFNPVHAGQASGHSM